MLKPYQIEAIKMHLGTAKRVGIKTAKVGAIFTSGVLVGAIAGIVLFFQISNDPV